MIPEALDFASMGLIPAGAYRNKEFREAMVVIEAGVDPARKDLLFDPQTSGGLLIGVKGFQSADLVQALKDAGVDESAEVGEVLAGPEEKIWVV